MKKEYCILFGGSFDPIHNGHIAIAKELYTVFSNPITFLPTGIPPYKDQSCVSAKERLEMLNLVISEYPGKFFIDDFEIKTNDFCYTYKTLTAIRKQIGKTTPLFFVIGSDSLITLDTWDNWQSLFDLTNFIVIMRPGYDIADMSNEVSREFKQRITFNLNQFKHSSSGKIYILDFTPIDVSSTQIRSKLKHNLSISEDVPNYITQYIIKHKLYNL